MALNPLFRGIFRVRGNVFCAHRITKCEREGEKRVLRGSLEMARRHDTYDARDPLMFKQMALLMCTSGCSTKRSCLQKFGPKLSKRQSIPDIQCHLLSKRTEGVRAPRYLLCGKMIIPLTGAVFGCDADVHPGPTYPARDGFSPRLASASINVSLLCPQQQQMLCLE